MKQPQPTKKFEVLKAARRVWTVSAIHGEADRLRAIHRSIEKNFQWGDRIVYLGSFLGHGTNVWQTINELLLFRRFTLSRFGYQPEDVVFLRGQQEEMWDKLMQIQFANDPQSIVSWMIDHGINATLEAYGTDGREALSFARQGVVELTNWTTRIRQRVRSSPGHFQLMTSLRRAAFTEDGSKMFVHAGIDASLPLRGQTDGFWWNTSTLPKLKAPFEGIGRIFSGYTGRDAGIEVFPYATTMDAGCGKGGPLIAACIDMKGDFQHIFEA
ncbi:MAG: hypothetical protein ACPGVN_04610 [Alphaproteobacteria bacterium]